MWVLSQPEEFAQNLAVELLGVGLGTVDYVVEAESRPQAEEILTAAGWNQTGDLYEMPQ